MVFSFIVRNAGSEKIISAFDFQEELSKVVKYVPKYFIPVFNSRKCIFVFDYL